ncbi:MAG: 50S ribosomal protein L7ae-like protein, partial [Clostridium baratii]|nr:50S ribosomal protein L7ae-like protein [Clostridium baratii]
MNKFFNFLGLAKRSGNLIEGYSKCNELRNKKKMYLFVISNDASESTKNKFIKH